MHWEWYFDWDEACDLFTPDLFNEELRDLFALPPRMGIFDMFRAEILSIKLGA